MASLTSPLWPQDGRRGRRPARCSSPAIFFMQETIALLCCLQLPFGHGTPLQFIAQFLFDTFLMGHVGQRDKTLDRFIGPGVESAALDAGEKLGPVNASKPRLAVMRRALGMRLSQADVTSLTPFTPRIRAEFCSNKPVAFQSHHGRDRNVGPHDSAFAVDCKIAHRRQIVEVDKAFVGVTETTGRRGEARSASRPQSAALEAL